MPMKMLYDAQQESNLIAQVLCGDRDAFDSILAVYQPVISKIALRLSREASVHEELLQAGRIGLYHAVKRFCPECGVRLLTYAWPWILGEMKKVLRTGFVNPGFVSLESGCDPAGRPLQEVLAGRQGIDIGRIDLRSAIKHLDEQEQILICLRYYRDKSQTETALLLNKSQSQVSKLERKALDKLCIMLS